LRCIPPASFLQLGGPRNDSAKPAGFDPAAFLSKAGIGRTDGPVEDQGTLLFSGDKGDSETKSSLVYKTAQSLAR